MIFSWTRSIFVGGDKLLPLFKHGFLRSEENVFPAIFQHTKCVWENVFLYNFQYLYMVGVITIHVGRCYCLNFINTLSLWQMLKPWLMLLPMFCGRCFKPQRQMFLTFLYMLGWCYCLLLFYVEGVIPHDLLQYFELADWLQRSSYEKEWSHLWVQMWQGGVWWGIYRGILQNLWREVQGTSKGPIPHIWPQ